MAESSNIPKRSGSARSGALWGLGIFLCLWLGTLGSVGEILLLLPALYVLDAILTILGVATGESILWRGLAAVLTGAVFSFVGARCASYVSSVAEKIPRAFRVTIILFLATFLVMVVLIGRHLRT